MERVVADPHPLGVRGDLVPEAELLVPGLEREVRVPDQDIPGVVFSGQPRGQGVHPVDGGRRDGVGRTVHRLRQPQDRLETKLGKKFAGNKMFLRGQVFLELL